MKRFITILAFCFGFAGQALAQDEPVNLGIVTFLSGPASGPFGIPSANAAELMIDALNKGEVPAPYQTMGLGGRSIVPIVIDEAGGTTKQVTEFRNMVERRGVHAVVGYISSGSCLGIAPVAEELKTLTVFFDCGTPRIFEEADYRYVFRTAAHGAMDNIGAARYLLAKQPELAAYAGINQNYAWGQDSWRDFHEAIKVLKPDAAVETEQFPKLFAGQYNAEITALIVSGAQAVHTSLWGGDLEAFLIQAGGRGLAQRTQLVVTTGENLMYTMADNLPEGIILGARGPYGVFAEPSPLNQWFRDSYEARFGTPPTYPSYHMAQAILGLKAAWEASATSDIESVIDAFENAEFESFGHTVEMKLGNGHQAVTSASYGIFKRDPDSGEPMITEILHFPPDCVNPPQGTSTEAWIAAGMPGAQCD